MSRSSAWQRCTCAKCPISTSTRTPLVHVVLACLAFCGPSGPLLPVQGERLLKDVLSNGEAPMHSSQVIETGLRVVRQSDGSLGLAEVAEGRKRPLKLAFYDDFDASNPPRDKAFILDTILPAAANLMGRFVRVRHPSGNLNFSGRLDADNKPIPPGPDGNGEYDADILVKVSAGAAGACGSAIAFAEPVLFETITRRPTFGQITVCRISPDVDFANNVQVIVHELIHVAGFASYLFGTFLGYQGGEQEVVGVSPIAANDYDYTYATPFRSSGELNYKYPSPGPPESPLMPALASAPAAALPPGPSAYDASLYLRSHKDYATASSGPLPAGTGDYGDPADYTDDYSSSGAPVPVSPGHYDADYPAYAYTPYMFPPGSSLFAGLDLEEILAYYDAPGPAQHADTAYAPDGYVLPAGGTGADGQGSSGDLEGRLSAAAVAAYTPEAGVITPNVLREARRHFGCPSMERVLLEDGFLSEPASHWSQRLYEGDIMRPSSSTRTSHYNREAMTDITLGFLQDTGWYDVKYGSGGFNTYGYRAGCAFVGGTFAEILADPAARRYVCPGRDFGVPRCLHDFSGEGLCLGGGIIGYDDFYTVDTFLGLTEDCQVTPGARCLNELGDRGTLLCLPGFSCSPTGQVLVDGAPCSDVSVMGCPPDELMCGDPGLLTCATPALNDCNGRGDCRQGRCFCHLGWGGDDCSTRVCTNSCPDGSACPASGFCGVPECGEWSVGDEGRGVPCTSN